MEKKIYLEKDGKEVEVKTTAKCSLEHQAEEMKCKAGVKKEEKEENEAAENEQEQFQQEQEPDKDFVINLDGLDIVEEIKKEVVNSVMENAPQFCEEILDRRIKSGIAKLAPIYVTVAERKEIKIEGRPHKSFQDALFLAQHEKQLFLSGPAGSGKTTLAEQVAKALELPFAFISCSAGLSEAHLLGRMLFDGTYVSSDFVNVYENGGVFLFDEIDAADSNTMLIVNSALANCILSVPNRKDNSHAKRHKDFICICAGNTWGNGSFEYHGRNYLDAAFLDRFSLSKLSVDYDNELEAEICRDNKNVYEFLSALRANCYKNKIRKVVSTRAFISMTRQVILGEPKDKIIDRLFNGWTNEEKEKALSGGLILN